MFTTVTLPMWVVVLAAVLAMWALLDRLLIPSVRWALRRRANRAIEELNARLHLHIQPFKLTRRQVLIDQVLHDHEVLHAVERHANEAGVPRDVAMERARRYAREIVPSFSAYAYFRIGTRGARWLSTLLYRVRLGYLNEESLSKVAPDSAVVFVINHRSNMDYVLVTYLAAASSALSYAVGEWARIWGLRRLIASMGAYFIRRNSRDPLYRKVLSRYVHMATRSGVTQAVFPEGGLSRDGRIRVPKFGLLSYMVSGFDPDGARDVVFIPVALNYDRILEDRVLTTATTNDGKAEFHFSPLAVLQFVLRNIGLALRGRWYRNGYACVSFGEPVSLRRYLAARNVDFRTAGDVKRNAEIEQLGHRLMAAVAAIVPALPVSMVATVFMADPDRSFTALELKARVLDLVTRLKANGAHVHVPRADLEYGIEVGLRMLTMRRLVVADGAAYRANRDDAGLLAFYANSIAHLLKPRVAVAQPRAASATGQAEQPLSAD